MRKAAADATTILLFQFSSGWWNGWFPGEATRGFKRESPDRVRAFHTKLERRIQLMILLLIKIRSIAGRLTALIVWTRKGRR
jgi:hypothetical protein